LHVPGKSGPRTPPLLHPHAGVDKLSTQQGDPDEQGGQFAATHVQLPPPHVRPLAHALAQLPQLLRSVCSLTQAPEHSE